MTVMQTEPIFVGRIEKATKAALDDRVIKILFLVPEDRVFKLPEWRPQMDEALDEVRVREALLHNYYEGVAIIFASQEALDKLPILLAAGRQHWLLGAGEFFPVKSSPAGNWSDTEIAIEAKSALGAQIYRLDALLMGASSNSGVNAELRRSSVLNFCAARLRYRLGGLLRATGSRRGRGDWQDYVEELRKEFGAPALRRLYAAPQGAAARLYIGTQWRREGRDMADGIGELDAIGADNPHLARDIQRLDFAAGLLARTAILERDGIATAVRQELLDDETMAAIVDIDSLPDVELATDAARRWNLNPADYFYRLGAMRGHFDAARVLGHHERTGRNELIGLASHGIRAIMREEGDIFFEEQFVQIRRELREAMPESLVELASAVGE